MKIWSVIILSIIICICCKPTVIEQHENGNPKIARHYSYFDKSRFTEYKYDRVGTIVAKIDYLDDDSLRYIDGAILKYHDNGSLAEERRLVKGRSEGIASYYHYDGSLRERQTYRDGRLTDTISISYYSNGQVEAIVPLRQGKAEGVWKRFYKTGVLMETATYVRDSLNGIMTTFDSTGKVERVTEWIMNEPEKIE